MADSTSNLDLISASQAQKEVTANELLNDASPAIVYGLRSSTSNLLTWGYYGGRFNGIAIANGTIALTASATNYIVANILTGAVTVRTDTVEWDQGSVYIRLYKVVTNTTTVASYQDYRTFLSTSGSITEYPYDVVIWMTGSPSNAQTLLKYNVPRPVSFPANLVGSTSAPAEAAATASAVFSIKKNGVEVATATYAAAGTQATFATTGGTAVSFAVGDTLSVVAPATADATLAGISLVIKGTR